MYNRRQERRERRYLSGLIGRVSWAKRKEGLGGIHPKAGRKGPKVGSGGKLHKNK
jgi:hypothetical protein